MSSIYYINDDVELGVLDFLSEPQCKSEKGDVYKIVNTAYKLEKI